MDQQHFIPGDPTLIENIVSYLKSKGIFDEFRHECLADVDTKSSCQNLSQRVDGYTTKFLSTETWNPDLNKNEFRNKLRRHIDESGMLAVGADHVVEQVINPKIGQLFLPRIIEVVHQYLKEETEKLNKKIEIVTNDNSSLEKPSSENTDGSLNKTKTPVLDPIADILSFTYSKAKSTTQNITPKNETVHKKANEVTIKAEKKKEDIAAKNIDSVGSKTEKKEENVQLVKISDLAVKNDPNNDTVQTQNAEKLVKSEIFNEDISINQEEFEFPTDNVILSTNTQVEIKESKLNKEIKIEETESQLDTQKNIQKEVPKLDKKKIEDVKLDDNKLITMSSKSSNLSKSKYESEKSKKNKKPFF